MRTLKEVEKKRDEVNEQIKKEYEWFKHFKEKGEKKECSEIAKWIMYSATELTTLEWVLGEGSSSEEPVTIPREVYNHLTNEKMLLNCLRYAGVESWEGYHTAQEMYEEGEL